MILGKWEYTSYEIVWWEYILVALVIVSEIIRSIEIMVSNGIMMLKKFGDEIIGIWIMKRNILVCEYYECESYRH